MATTNPNDTPERNLLEALAVQIGKARQARRIAPTPDPCPECYHGTIITTGFTDPRATAAYCSEACGWTA